METRLLLIILINCLYETKAEALPQPKLKLDRLVITETDSVTLNCSTPSNVSVSGCDFYMESLKISDSLSCVKTLTGTELLNMTKKKSPAEVKVRCFYTVNDGAFKPTSVDSETTTIIINNLLPPALTVSPQLITETDSLTLNCQTPSSVSLTECYFKFEKKPSAKRFPCVKNLTASELLSLTQQRPPARVDVTCFYLKSHRSPKSSVSTIFIRFPRPELTVEPQLITETDSVTLNCQTPSSVSVTECFLYFMRSKWSRIISCEETLTGSELLFMTHQSSPAVVELSCYYTVEHKGGQVQSAESQISSVNIQKPTGSSPSPVTEDVVKTDSTTFQSTPAFSETTEFYPSELTVRTSVRTTDTVSSASLTSVEPSPADSTVAITTDCISRQSTSLKTDSTGSDTKKITEQKPLAEAALWIKFLFVAGPAFGVLLGLVLLGALLYSIRRRRRRSEKYFYMRSQSNLPATGDAIRHFDSGGQSPAAPDADTPTELVQLNRHNSQNENTDVYHVYSTINDEPAASTLMDTTYCTLQAH